MKRNNMHNDNIPTIIAAACVLHNICEVHGEHFNDGWLEIDTGHESTFEQPSTVIHRNGSNERPKEIRHVLLHFFTE